MEITVQEYFMHSSVYASSKNEGDRAPHRLQHCFQVFLVNRVENSITRCVGRGSIPGQCCSGID